MRSGRERLFGAQRCHALRRRSARIAETDGETADACGRKIGVHCKPRERERGGGGVVREGGRELERGQTAGTTWTRPCAKRGPQGGAAAPPAGQLPQCHPRALSHMRGSHFRASDFTEASILS